MPSTFMKRLAAEQQANRERLAQLRQPVNKKLEQLQTERDSIPKQGVFKSLGHFLYDVRKLGTGQAPESIGEYQKAMTDYMQKAFPSGMNTVIGADGGVFMPPEYANEILMNVFSSDLLSQLRHVPMTSNEFRIRAIDETSRATGSRFGGVTAYWRQEGPPSSLTATKPKFNVIKLRPEALYVMVELTDEELEDYPAMESILYDVVSQEIEFAIGLSVFSGTGAGQPMGLMNSPSKLALTQVPGQGATVLPDNVFQMYMSLPPRSRANMVWLVSNLVWPQLFGMQIGNVPIFLPNQTIAGQQYNLLLGRPVLETEYNYPTGTEGDIVAFDPQTYLLGQRGDLKFQSSMHVYFDRAAQAFRYDIRVDGRSWWQSKLTMLRGTNNYVSNIVTLETRS